MSQSRQHSRVVLSVHEVLLQACCAVLYTSHAGVGSACPDLIRQRVLLWPLIKTIGYSRQLLCLLLLLPWDPSYATRGLAGQCLC